MFLVGFRTKNRLGYRGTYCFLPLAESLCELKKTAKNDVNSKTFNIIVKFENSAFTPLVCVGGQFVPTLPLRFIIAAVSVNYANIYDGKLLS